MRARAGLMIVVAGALGAFALGACSDDGGGETVDVTLSEFVVEADPASVDSGEVTFKADDVGSEVHELVVVAAPSAADLPTDANGAVDEAPIPKRDFVGEIEDIEPGSAKEATFDLDPGSYVLFCNIVEEEEDGEVESHFAEGMYTTLTVE